MAATSMAAVPPPLTALETYLGFLESSSSATEKEPLMTPHIDRVLHCYQHRAKGRKEGVRGRVERGGASSSSTVHAPSEVEGGGYESRLMQLERQLSQLLQKSKTARKRGPSSRQSHSPETSLSMSSGSCDEEETTPMQQTTPQRTHKFRTSTAGQPRPSPQRTAASARKRREKKGKVTNTKENVAEERWDRSGRLKRRQTNVRVVREKVGEGGGGRREEREKGGKREGEKGVRGEGVQVSTVQEDCQVKTKLAMETRQKQETRLNTATVKELEGECERRRKAEMAAGRLVEHVRSLQTHLEESTRERELSVARVAKLDGELRVERERGASREEEARWVQESLAAAGSELEAVRGRAEEQKKAVREMVEERERREANHVAEKTELLDRVHTTELASSGHQRETEIAKSALEEMRRQLHQMQELLATRERDHQKALQNCKPLDGREVQEVVSCKVEQERERMVEVVAQHKQRLSEQQKAYQALEDEFRMALRIEASRYHELRECYDRVQGQVDGYQAATEAALRKEQKATHMVAELTAIVREQRGRLAELGRAKQDSVQELKERVSELEAGVKEKHKLEVKVQSLQEENSRLGSQLSAQESVLEGLRGERQLWGRELAQQGAELAQDRGRMEAQIEALSHESASLQEDLQHARDSVRVKEKVVADQQASISQLREALAAREREGEEVRQDWEREQQSLQLQLEQETETSSHLQEELSAAVERKAQLKEELSSVREELAQWKTKYSKLRGEWEERMKVIGSLEESLAQVRDTFSQREAAIIRDRDEAAQRASTAEGRLRENEEAHRKQLEAKQTSHDNQLTILVQQKDQEIEEANQKVSTVEGEMRELLVEVTREKQAMESRVQRMSLALQQLQQDFTR